MMFMDIRFPFPPSVNCMFRGGSGQKRFMTTKYFLWLMMCPKLDPVMIENASIYYFFYFPDKRARDMGNLIKPINDYLVKSKVILDDNWKSVNEVTLLSRGVNRENPRVDVRIYYSCIETTIPSLPI